ncbi:MAG: EamA family transporter [Rhizomicrobium sp.]
MASGRGTGLAVGALLIAMFCFQTGASLAQQLFPLVGAQGTVALRTGWSALILILFWHPWRARIGRRNWQALVVYGAALGTMNFLFYMALRTVPLGIAVALEFSGPLAVALIASRRARDFLWALLAMAGLLLLLPIREASGVSWGGASFALGAGVCWALYIIFGQKAGLAHGQYATVLGAIVAALVIMPVGFIHSGWMLFRPGILAFGLLVAALSSAVPYSLEMVALRRIPAPAFGTLMSLEPAMGSLMGLLLLSQQLSLVQWSAVAMVVLASMGAALSVTRQPHPRLPD